MTENGAAMVGTVVLRPIDTFNTHMRRIFRIYRIRRFLSLEVEALSSPKQIAPVHSHHEQLHSIHRVHKVVAAAEDILR